MVYGPVIGVRGIGGRGFRGRCGGPGRAMNRSNVGVGERF